MRRNPYFSMLLTAWEYAKEHRPKFILIYSMFVAANIVVAMNPLFYGWFVSEVQHKGTAVINTAWMYVGGFLLLKLLEWSFHGPARVMERQLAFKVGKNFIDEKYRKVLALPLEWHQEHHTGTTINKLRKAHEALRDFFQQGFIYLYSFWKFIFSFAAMIYFSPLFGLIGVALGLVTVLIIIRFDKPYIRSLKEVNRREHEVSSNLVDNLSNIRTVITLKLEQNIHERLLEKVQNVFPPFKMNVIINEWKWFTAQMMVALIYSVTVFGYLYQHWTPGAALEIGGLIVLIGYVNQFTSVFNDIAAQYTQITRFHTEVQNVQDLDHASGRFSRATSQRQLPRVWQEINITNLNFQRPQYVGKAQPAGLYNLNMRIRNGERIALIGESGSGKSTLLSLLRGLYSPASSTTTLDQKEILLDHIAGSVTLLPQEPEIFESSVLYNITMGLPFSEEEVREVCRQAHFLDVVTKLPSGLHTHIQEKGINLSGGQKQRLALARGILAARHSDIILMDEPTSSVDPRTEQLIYANLFASFSGKTVISSLHRLHLLRYFDYVYILRDGSVIDEGTFEDLKRYSLVFQDMWVHQAQEEDYPKLNVAL